MIFLTHNMIFNKTKLLITLFCITLISYLIKVKGMDFNQIIFDFKELISNDTIFYISKKIYLASIWFLIGIYSYIKLLPKSIILKINRLNILEFLLILFSIFMVKYFLETFLFEYLASLINEGTIYNWLGQDNPTPSLPSPRTNPIDNASNGAIMTAAFAAGYKMAQNCPSIAGKVGAVAGGVGAGALAIAAKNISDNVSSDIGKKSKKLIFDGDLMDILKDHLNLTGNHGIDLLSIIQYFQILQLILILLICYNLFFTHINIIKLESLLLRFLPVIIVRWYIRSLAFYQRSSLIILICLIILLAICNGYSYFYLQFFIDNLYEIVDYYFKK